MSQKIYGRLDYYKFGLFFPWISHVSKNHRLIWMNISFSVLKLKESQHPKAQERMNDSVLWIAMVLLLYLFYSMEKQISGLTLRCNRRWPFWSSSGSTCCCSLNIWLSDEVGCQHTHTNFAPQDVQCSPIIMDRELEEVEALLIFLIVKDGNCD